MLCVGEKQASKHIRVKVSFSFCLFPGYVGLEKRQQDKYLCCPFSYTR